MNKIPKKALIVVGIVLLLVTSAGGYLFVRFFLTQVTEQDFDNSENISQEEDFENGDSDEGEQDDGTEAQSESIYGDSYDGWKEIVIENPSVKFKIPRGKVDQTDTDKYTTRLDIYFQIGDVSVSMFHTVGGTGTGGGTEIGPEILGSNKVNFMGEKIYRVDIEKYNSEYTGVLQECKDFYPGCVEENNCPCDDPENYAYDPIAAKVYLDWGDEENLVTYVQILPGGQNDGYDMELVDKILESFETY